MESRQCDKQNTQICITSQILFHALVSVFTSSCIHSLHSLKNECDFISVFFIHSSIEMRSTVLLNFLYSLLCVHHQSLNNKYRQQSQISQNTISQDESNSLL